MDELEKMLEEVDLLSDFGSFEEKLLAGIKDIENGNYVKASVFLKKMKEKYADAYDG